MMPDRKPQTGSPSLRDDQLMMPTRVRSFSSNTGPPESPLQTPSPALSPSLCGSTRLSCWELGRSVATRVAARSLPALLRSPCTATPKPATMKRSPTAGGTRRSLNAAGIRFGAGRVASLTSARSGASERVENCGCGVTAVTSLLPARRPSNVTSRYLPLSSTQWAAVSTRSTAIATPLQRLRSPAISTTWRAIVGSAGCAPPTRAAAGTVQRTGRAARQAIRRSIAAMIPLGDALSTGLHLHDRAIGGPDRASGSCLAIGLARRGVFLLEEGLLDLGVDAQQPSLGARGAIAEMGSLCLGLAHALLGGPQLK